MKEKRAEGVVLRSTPYKENDRILTLLTPDRGVISLYVRSLSKTKPALVNVTTPLCQGEFVFRKGRSDLYRFVDGSIIDLHRGLRRSYRHLELGGKMLQAILQTQMPGKECPELYHLLTIFLKKLGDTSSPEMMWAAFQVKLLKHEGLVEVSETCLACQRTSALQLTEGESHCSSCGGGGNSFYARRLAGAVHPF